MGPDRDSPLPKQHLLARVGCVSTRIHTSLSLSLRIAPAIQSPELQAIPMLSHMHALRHSKVTVGLNENRLYDDLHGGSLEMKQQIN